MHFDVHESKPANSFFFIYYLFDKLKANTLLHNVLKVLVPSMSLYPSFRQLSNRLYLTPSLFNETKPVKTLILLQLRKAIRTLKKHCKLHT